jgi:hypothetical protein
MRSISFTLLLLLLTTGIIVMVTMSTKEGGFDGIFGKQATPVGSNLYHLDNDEIQSIHRILLSGNGVQAEAVFEKGIWHMTKPWNDRMDPRASDPAIHARHPGGRHHPRGQAGHRQGGPARRHHRHPH